MKKGAQSVLFSVLVGALLLCAGCGKSGDIYTAVQGDGGAAAGVQQSAHGGQIKIPRRCQGANDKAVRPGGAQRINGKEE